MVIISKAEQTEPQYVGRLLPLARRIVTDARLRRLRPSDTEPLAEWIVPRTARLIRSIETEIRVLVATIADRTAIEAVVAKGLKAGHPFDMDVGGLADESAGQPVRIEGTIAGVAHVAGRH